MASFSREEPELHVRVWHEIEHLPRGPELINDLNMAVLRLLAVGADRDAVKIMAIHACDKFVSPPQSG